MEFALPSELETKNFKIIGSKSTLNLLDRRFIENLNHIQKVFFEINNFPPWVIKQIFAEAEQKYKHQNIEDKDSNVINIKSGNKRHLLVLPYQDEQGSRLVKSLKRSITKLLSKATQLEFGFTGSKLSTHFQIKDKAEFEHNHDVVYLGTCLENNCSDNYVSESARHISERIIDHNGRNQNSHFFKHSCIKNHPNTSKTDFQIISSGFKNNYCRRKIAEALLIKQIKPSLNVQEKSYELKLFN